METAATIVDSLAIINAICDGNDMYDELYGDLDVEDVVQ